ncbi:hypothetical protein GGD83_003231 [Rhodoblastus sphagnicola]|nr:hypothetical protein [Rhodoblastus sphagnicola]MBB4199416.1 hypothetical protein [Rhodoblastus sphagnicola]
MTPARSRTLAFIFSLPLLATAAPAQAGFWEELFGVREKPAAAVAPSDPVTHAPPPKHANKGAARGERHGKTQIEANLALKAAQAGKDPAMLALQDNTLRRGDVVSGPSGLMVYMGGDPEHPSAARFVPANDPNLAKGLRETLQGLKRPAATAAPDAKTATRAAPAPSAQPVSIERDGKVVRVVGSYQGEQ